MKSDIKNLDLLFSNNQRDIYQGLLEKKDWINRKLILNGNLDYYIDSHNNKRFIYLENLFDNVIAFQPVHYENKNFDNQRVLDINEQLNTFKRATFKTKINLEDDAPFYVEYNFNNLDALGYKTLVANFYYMHKEEDLNINFKNKDLDPKDLVKLSMIGDEEDVCFVLNDETLINGVFFLPIVSAIYIAKPIEADLYNELQMYCEEHNIPLEVIYEDRKNSLC